MIINRDYYLDYMTYTRKLKPIFIEIFGLLVGVDEEWRSQGATPEEISLRAFDLDRIKYFPMPVVTGMFGGLKPEVLEETDEYIVKRDSLGRTMKLCKGYATIPLPLDFPVKNMNDWLKLKPYFTYTKARLPDGWLEKTKKAREDGCIIMVSIPGGFDIARELMGEEVACLSYYDQPDLMRDILETITETAYRVIDEVTSQIPVDMLDVHEDLAGRSGSLIGPNIIREFIKPYYRTIWDLVEARGTKLFRQDSDGNLNSVLEAFMEAGVNFTFPCEPQAGMDVVEIRKRFGPELRMMGGIDKMVIRKTKEDIDRELEYKLPYMIRSGGYIIALDHRIPNGVPIENYRYYVKRVREILDREWEKIS